MFFQFRFVIFWKKDTGAQAACKMLVKLTTIVDFKNDETSRPCGNKYELCKRALKDSTNGPSLTFLKAAYVKRHIGERQ